MAEGKLKFETPDSHLTYSVILDANQAWLLELFEYFTNFVRLSFLLLHFETLFHAEFHTCIRKDGFHGHMWLYLKTFAED